MKKLTFSSILAAALFCGLLFQACQKEKITGLAEGLNLNATAKERCICLPPYTISITALSSNAATIVWDEMPESMGYQVEWLMGTTSSVIDSSLMWESFVEGNSLVLSDLKPNRQYAVRVINVCREVSSEAPAWVPFKTSPKAALSSKVDAVVK